MRSVSPTIRTSVIRRRSYPRPPRRHQVPDQPAGAQVESAHVSADLVRFASGSPRYPTSGARRRCSSGTSASTCPPRRPGPRRRRWRRSAASPRSLRGRRDRLAPRTATAARGVARVRLGRGEPDRVTRGDWDKEGASPPSSAPRCSRRRRGAPHVGGRAGHERLLELPAGARAEPRAEAALRRVLRVGRLALHGAARRLRAVHDDHGGRRDLRHRAAGALGARAGGPTRRAGFLELGTPSTSSTSSELGWPRRSGSRRAPGGSTRPAHRSAAPSRTGTSGSRRATTRPGSTRSGRRCTRPGTACTRTASPPRSSGRHSPPPRPWA